MATVMVHTALGLLAPRPMALLKRPPFLASKYSIMKVLDLTLALLPEWTLLLVTIKAVAAPRALLVACHLAAKSPKLLTTLLLSCKMLVSFSLLLLAMIIAMPPTTLLHLNLRFVLLVQLMYRIKDPHSPTLAKWQISLRREPISYLLGLVVKPYVFSIIPFYIILTSFIEINLWYIYGYSSYCRTRGVSSGNRHRRCWTMRDDC